MYIFVPVFKIQVMRINSLYYKQNINIAFPIMLSLAGQAIVQMADNIMVGQLGAPELAAVSLAGAIIMNTMVVGMGIATGLTPLVGQAHALDDKERIAGFFQNSLLLNTTVSLILTLFLFMLMPYLSMMGQPAEVVELCKGYYILTSFSVIPFILFMTFKQYMEGIGNTKVAMVITISCNLMNIFLNYIFIYGKFGAPFLGVAGAGLATLISRLMMPVAFFLYIHRSQIYSPVFRFFQFSNTSRRKIKQLLQVGYPIAGQMVVEFLSLSLITVMMGWLGTIALAANQIVMSMISLTFMISSGIAGASTILVSHEFGRGNIGKMRRYAHASLRLAVIFMAGAAVIYAFFGAPIASIFTPDPEVIKVARNLFFVVAVFEIFDGLQVTALGALRGITDVQRPMIYALVSYLFVAVPLAYIAGILLDFGAPGLLSGFCGGLMFAATLFIRRFNKSVRNIRQQRVTNL